ncbi:MAG: rhomboid family intramembrane serine protease [Brevinematales bacterium]|jgi:membrane associated rhomboid family serine protease
MIPIRDENPPRSFPLVTCSIIILNFIVFILQQSSMDRDNALIYHFSMIPSIFFHDPSANWFRPITYLFLHGGYLHIIGNMLFLFIFGGNIEDILGHIRFIFFYLAVGACGGLFQAALTMGTSDPIIGASGAISGVLTAYILLFPNRRILTIIFLGFFIMPVRIPAFIYITIWIGGQLLGLASSVLGRSGSNVAYFVHFGGIIAGFLYISVQRRSLLRKYYT